MKPSMQRALVAPENQPQAYNQLTTAQRAALGTWIARTLHPIKAANLYQSSATLPGVFTRSAGGCCAGWHGGLIQCRRSE